MDLFLWVGAAGFGFFLFLLVFGELFDLFSDLDVDHPGPFNLKVAALGLVGFGAFGYAADALGLGQTASWAAGGIGFVFVAMAGFLLVVRPIRRWQSNSAVTRASYSGAEGEVTLEIPAGDWGQVAFHDRNNARVIEKAIGVQGTLLPRGTPVLIVDVVEDGVIVTENPLQ